MYFGVYCIDNGLVCFDNPKESIFRACFWPDRGVKCMAAEASQSTVAQTATGVFPRRFTAAPVAALFLLFFFASVSWAQPEKLRIDEDGFTSSEVCGKCHTQIFKAWKESMHARAVSDPIFRASYITAIFKKGEEAARLCLKCHSPTTRITHARDLDKSLTAEGITCDFCHSVRGIDIEKLDNPFTIDLGKVKYGPNEKGDVKVHDVAYSESHGKAEFCATCHEYRPNGVPVMSTYSEWKESPYAEEGKQCQYCHMPESKGEISNDVPGRRGGKIFNHHLAGGHSITQLQKALALKISAVERKKDRMTVHVDVTNAGSGHRVPTGVPTRKLILFCEVRIPGGKVYKEKIVYEKAIFDAEGFELTSDADIMLGLGRSVWKDNRIFPKETRKETFTFYLPKNKEARISVWVDYLYEPVILQETEMRIEMNRDEKVSSP